MEISDPTSGTTEPTRYWTTANIGEATPDVLSPMCWSFWGPQAELSARRSYWRFGILAKREVTVPEDPNALMTNYFYGRPALNVDVLRPFFGSIPGVSADDFERDMCGKLRPDQPDAKRPQRLPFIAAKGPYAMWSTPRRLRDLVPRQRAWWESAVRDRPAGAGDPAGLLAQAAERYRESFEIHCCGRFVLMSAQSTLTKLAIGVDRPDLVMRLLAGLGGVTEVELADDLWLVSRDRLTLDEFVGRHGFHGPNEGNVSGVSWREDRAPVERLVSALAERPDDERPRAREQSGVVAHRAALDEFLAALSPKQQRKARRAAAALTRSTQANEVGKACYLMAIDGARAAARDLGRQHVAAGRLAEVDDVFSFTMDEARDLPSNAGEIVAFRRDRRDHYRTLTLPVTFTGMPEPVEREATVGDDDVVTGAAASPGLVEGIARVVTDPDTAPPLDDGEILVCRFTDPSWTPLFMLASALVIDIGGPTSHGAIVARELGIPCVIGTGNGTLVIRSGDRIAVDGASGEVAIIARAAPVEPLAG
jgi:pyruvate,water dikinase